MITDKYYRIRAFAFFCLYPLLGSAQPALDIAGPPGSGLFGSSVTLLPNGNFVVTDPGFDLTNPAVSNVGAVYLYRPDATLISRLTGMAANDAVGTAVVALSNGNFVVQSHAWRGARGAVTWGSANTGVAGTVSASNSLVGAVAGDQVGLYGITLLSNGHYVVRSDAWDGAVVDAGAVSWGNGNGGTQGVVSASNSLIGANAYDRIGDGGVTALSNGNYLVRSSNWDAPGPLRDAGAVSWGNGATGTVGVVSAGNSLVGTSVDDKVGERRIGIGGITVLSNGNYVVNSPRWRATNPVVQFAGAVTWGSGNSGTMGVISASNSLVGGTQSDAVGSDGVTALSNGNYVVSTTNWHATNVPSAGAVTWCNGSTATVGLVSADNSLIGASGNDFVGLNGVTALSNGNYVVRSLQWDASPSARDVGAVTWGSGIDGTVGLVSSSNSLVGTTTSELTGIGGITPLSNGNYVVATTFWGEGRGALTWGNGAGGIVGVVSEVNSLVGAGPGDNVSFGGVTALSNGNYVVASTSWDMPEPVVENVGAVTWGNGGVGTTGIVSSSNSLIGTRKNDFVGGGGITALRNGHYTVASRYWDAGNVADVGAVSWGNGATGAVGVVGAHNSLVGTRVDDLVGIGGVTALSNGNYVVRSLHWDLSLALIDAGAVSWGNGNGGSIGRVSPSNSLVGTAAQDLAGGAGITALGDGNYVVHTRHWDAATPLAADAGAITFGSGSAGGTVGPISSENSILGTAAGGGGNQVFAYDVVRKRLIIGRRSDNIVTILSGLVASGAKTRPKNAAN